MSLLSAVLLTKLSFVALLYALNCLAYRYLKNRTLRKRNWDLNICCGTTDGGGINADIVRHGDIRRFVLIEDIYRLPFRDKEFETALCSHTIEHVDDPAALFAELQRVSKSVTLLVPPIWDVAAALNFFEHKWIFLTIFTKHRSLPRYVRLPLAHYVQRRFGQVVRA